MLIKSALRDYLPALIIIQGRSADNRKAPLNFSFPLEGKCHVVAKGCTRVSIPMKLTIVLLGPTSADLEPLCRVSTKRRILVRTVSRGNATKYQSAGRFAPWLIFPATSNQQPSAQRAVNSHTHRAYPSSFFLLFPTSPVILYNIAKDDVSKGGAKNGMCLLK